MENLDEVKSFAKVNGRKASSSEYGSLDGFICAMCGKEFDSYIANYDGSGFCEDCYLESDR